MDDAQTPAGAATLPKYVRFARSLALVSGAAIGFGIAVGSTVFTAAGCQSCVGAPCGGQVYGVSPQPDASGSADHDAADAKDAGDDAAMVADGGTGGGPRPAPPLPAAWLA